MSFACSQAFHTHYKLWALEYSTCTIYPGLNRSELGEGKQMCIHVCKVWLLQDWSCKLYTAMVCLTDWLGMWHLPVLGSVYTWNLYCRYTTHGNWTFGTTPVYVYVTHLCILFIKCTLYSLIACISAVILLLLVNSFCRAHFQHGGRAAQCTLHNTHLNLF